MDGQSSDFVLTNQNALREPSSRHAVCFSIVCFKLFLQNQYYHVLDLYIVFSKINLSNRTEIERSTSKKNMIQVVLRAACPSVFASKSMGEIEF